MRQLITRLVSGFGSRLFALLIFASRCMSFSAPLATPNLGRRLSPSRQTGGFARQEVIRVRIGFSIPAAYLSREVKASFLRFARDYPHLQEDAGSLSASFRRRGWTHGLSTLRS